MHSLWWIASGVGLLGALYAGARARWFVVRVNGMSMHPAAHHGQLLLARRTRALPDRGAVVVARPFVRADPVVKRLAAIPGDVIPDDVARAEGHPPGSRVPDGSVVLLGDNQRFSLDSRSWGLVPASAIRAKVIRALRGGSDPALLLDEPIPVSQMHRTDLPGSITFHQRTAIEESPGLPCAKHVRNRCSVDD